MVFLKRDGILALNPGSLRSTGEFIVLDMDTQAIDYRNTDKSIFRINENENSELTKMRARDL